MKVNQVKCNLFIISLPLILSTLCTSLIISATPVFINQTDPQYYVGCYFGRLRFRTTRAIMKVQFDIDPSIIPFGSWIGPVISANGAHPKPGGGYKPSHWVYQAGLMVERDGTVYFHAEVWYCTLWETERVWVDEEEAGTLDYYCFYPEIRLIWHDLQSFWCYSYKTYSDVINKDPDYHCLPAFIETGDEGFFAGYKWAWTGVAWRKVKYTQFGVESPTKIVGDWKIYLSEMACSCDGKFCYWKAYSVQGNKAYINHYEDRVGGIKYEGVDALYTSADYVCWAYTGTTIGNDVLLWDEEGEVTPAPYDP